jgi:hypothetical protein
VTRAIEKRAGEHLQWQFGQLIGAGS